jgi:hypothetical protein
MKKPLTFLLSLTFLFLFSGNSFGGVFDKTDENVVLYCSYFGRYVINMKDKTVKHYYENELKEIYTINKENEVLIEGVNKTKTGGVVIYRHQIENAILLQFADIKEGKIRIHEKSIERYCVIGDKKF